MSATTTRLTAEERREAVIDAAGREFAHGGYSGTSTQSIAKRVGVSQPYLFQLFGTKRELFIAVIRSCFARTWGAFEQSARATRARTDDSGAILDAMGHAYVGLLRDRDMLRLQLQGYAACGDPAIQAAVREEWTKLYESVARISGADELTLHHWFAEGMLLNVAASIGDLDDAIALKLTGGVGPSGF